MKMVKQESGAFWIPEKKGDYIEGKVIATQEGNYGTHFLIESDKGTFKTPAHKVLISRMGNIKIGDYVKIEYLGEELPKVKGQNPTKIYDVYKGTE